MPSESGSAVDTINRCASSIRTNTEPFSASPNLVGNNNNNNNKTKKHVVLAGRAHTRNFSNKGLHSKIHGDSHLEPGGSRKPLRNASTTSLKKNNNSHVNLKRNRSSAEVKPKFAVTFELGEHEDGWEETSASTSPAVSRSTSRPTSMSKSQVSKTKPEVPLSTKSISKTELEPSTNKQFAVHPSTIQSRMITERLLSRTPSQHTTHMSLAIATSVANSYSSPSSPNRNGHVNTLKNTRSTASSNLNAGLSQFLFNHPTSSKTSEDVKRIQSMKDLAHYTSDEEENSTLHSRPLGAGRSRTQQKLWLQRASSIIEPKQLIAPYENEIGFLLGSSDVGRESRVKSMLGRTGIEYLVVRRYQDPVGNALKRISQIPGMNRNNRIPSKSKKFNDESINNSSGGRNGLSQSLRSYTQGKVPYTPSPTSGSRKSMSDPHDFKDIGQEFLNIKQGSSKINSEDITVMLTKLWDKNLADSRYAVPITCNKDCPDL